MNIPFEQIKLLVFDLDNTLINRDKAYFNYLKSAFVSVKKEDVWKKHQTEIMAYDNHGYRNRTEMDIWLTSHFIDEVSYHEFQQKYCVADFVTPLYLNFLDFLQKLKKHYQLALLSNGGIRNQSIKIQKAGLTDIFSPTDIFISGAYNIEKPQQSFFRLVQNHYNLSPSQIVMIGDDYRNDIEGANKVDWYTIWLSRDEKSNHTANLRIKEINELASYL